MTRVPERSITAETGRGDLLRVLGLDALTGCPLDPLPLEAARRRARRALRRGLAPRYGVASDDLASAGWGVVFPAEVDPAVREALEPLLDLRRKQAGERYRELHCLPGEASADFRTRLRAGLGRVDPRQIPWYLLVAGEPTEIPYGFEFDLGMPHAVGRLALESPGDLAAYAQRVVDAEERGLGMDRETSPRAAVFAPTHPDDPATASCVEHLAAPLAEQLAGRCTGHSAGVTALLARVATRERLLEVMHSGVDLLVAAGHSTRFPTGHRAQGPRQGALVCADWPGRVRCPGGIPPEHTVAAEDLSPGVLCGGVALLFGCFTAGTPVLDPFDSEDPENARRVAPQPFASALGRRMLGCEGGAMGVIGHVGRAFEASFLWRGVRQIAPFEDTVAALLDGRRIGEALDGFGQRFADLAVTWARSGMGMEAPELDLLGLWIAFHDARSWCLLGDPAVRLPASARAGI